MNESFQRPLILDIFIAILTNYEPFITANYKLVFMNTNLFIHETELLLIKVKLVSHYIDMCNCRAIMLEPFK